LTMTDSVIVKDVMRASVSHTHFTFYFFQGFSCITQSLYRVGHFCTNTPEFTHNTAGRPTPRANKRNEAGSGGIIFNSAARWWPIRDIAHAA
jgi:hypothetical protein